MRTLRLATVAAVCALGTVICLVAGAVAMGPGVRDLIPQTGRPGRDWIGRGSGRRVVLRWAWWSSWSGFWDRCTGGFLRHPSSGRPVMILAPVLGAVGLTLVTVSHLIPIAIGYELVPAVRDGAASVAQVIWAFGFSSRHRSRRFTTRVEQRRHDDQRAGYDEGHPAPSQEPQEWASVFRHHPAGHGYPTSREETGGGVWRLANAPGRRHSSQAATKIVSMTAASWVMLPASAPSSRESTSAPLLLLASKI
jgi:hypothetical protein